MRRVLVCAGISAIAVALAYPSTGSAEWSFGLMPVSNDKVQITFNEGTQCSFSARVSRAGRVAKSNGRYVCKHPQKKPVRPIRVRIKNRAGRWPLGTYGPMTTKTCTTLTCEATEATYDVASNNRATANLIFDIYYSRSAGFFVPPPGCEYVKDPQGKAPPGHRITCAIQAR